METSPKIKKPRRAPLPVVIPLDLADVLGVHFTFISKINNGHIPVPLDFAIRVLWLALNDERLAGLTLLDMKPELGVAIPYLCSAKHRRKPRK